MWFQHQQHSQWGLGTVECMQTISLPHEGREVVSEGPLAQVQQINAENIGLNELSGI